MHYTWVAKRALGLRMASEHPLLSMVCTATIAVCAWNGLPYHDLPETRSTLWIQSLATSVGPAASKTCSSAM